MSYRLVCWLIITFACFYGLGSYPLLDNNEGLYAAIARDMLRGGDWIIPHLNGNVYIEKPPLLYWAMAGSMALFGVNEFAARLPLALSLFTACWLLQRFLARQGRSDAGYIAALIFATSLPLTAIGRTILFDMPMTCFLTAALMCFYEWHRIVQRRMLLGLYFFLALAVLTKGLVTLVLAGGVISVFLHWQRTPWRQYLRLLFLPGIVLFLAIAAPWHMAAALKEPDFAWFYFINEHLRRFLGTREPHDYYTGPVWYYLPRIAAYLLPWTPFLALLIKRKVPGSSLSAFLWIWLLFFLTFFSLSSGKANYYMLAGMPPFIMLLALRMEAYAAASSRTLPSIASACLIAIASMPLLTHRFCHEDSGKLYPLCEIASVAVITIAVVYALIGSILCWRLPRRWTPPLLASYIFLLLPVAITGLNLAQEHVSQKAVVDFLKQSSYPHVALYHDFEKFSALAFYRESPMTMVDNFSDDLLYGQRHGGPHFISLREWAAEKETLPLVVRDRHMPELVKAFPEEYICTLHRFALVTVVDLCKRIQP